ALIVAGLLKSASPSTQRHRLSSDRQSCVQNLSGYSPILAKRWRDRQFYGEIGGNVSTNVAVRDGATSSIGQSKWNDVGDHRAWPRLGRAACGDIVAAQWAITDMRRHDELFCSSQHSKDVSRKLICIGAIGFSQACKC